jgi:hypothetical protein
LVYVGLCLSLLVCWSVGLVFLVWESGFALFFLIKMTMEETKIDKWGWSHYDKLPEGFRLATINDFHFQGKKKIGLGYLVRWRDNKNYFEIRMIDEKLTAEWLMPFIKEERVFVKN